MATKTLTLTGFLLARIAEDESRNTKRVIPDGFLCPVNPDDDIIEVRVPIRYPDGERGATLWPCLHAITAEQYAAVSIPQPISRRMAVECDAKRRIVDAIRSRWDGLAHQEDYADRDAALRLLALPYADHPDYRDEWRP